MSIEYEIEIPGAGQNWYTPKYLEINRWLMENIPNHDYVVWWKGPDPLRSDTVVIRFNDEKDATAFKLKWM